MSPDSGREARWLNADEQAAWRGWLDTYRLLIPVLDRQLQASRVSFTEYEVLVCLSEATDQRLRMSEVADRTLATRSAITRTVDRLVARGWVRRVRSMQDQRGAYANLTESGAQALAELAPGHVLAVRQNLIDLLTPVELEALRTIGRRVKRRLAGRDGWSPRLTLADTDPADDVPVTDTNGVGPAGSDRANSDLQGWARQDSDREDSDREDSDRQDSERQDSGQQDSGPQDSAWQDADRAGSDTPDSANAAADTIAEDAAVTAGPDR